MVDSKKNKPTRTTPKRKSGAGSAGRKTATAKPKAKPKKKTVAKTKTSSRKSTARAKTKSHEPMEQLGTLFEGISDLRNSALKFATKTRKRAAKGKEQASDRSGREFGKAPSPEQLRNMAAAGESLRDLREVAGLTLSEISDALKLKDKSFIQAVEDGREVLSLELIMRMASLYARNDPIPFVINHIRTYRPKLWETLEEWGLAGYPVKMERERKFMNIYKRRDAARELSNEGFEKVIAFTQQAFEMALHFVAQLEEIENNVNPEFADVEEAQEPVDQA